MTDLARKMWRRRLVAGVLLAMAVGVAVAVTGGPQPSTGPKLPDPNGYDDLVEAGLLVGGTWPNNGDVAKAEFSPLKSFVEANRASLDRARVGLGRECVVPLANTPSGLPLHIEHVSPIRAVGRLLRSEAIVAEAEGRIVAASRAYRDELALGQAVTQGGTSMDQTLGASLQWQAVEGLRKLRDRLPREEIAALLPELQTLDKKRIPIDEVEARWLAWFQGATNPAARYWYRMNGLEKQLRAAERSMAETSQARSVRELRLLLVELAIHAYHLDAKAWPRSVKDLVPKYLAAVPIDPNTNKPLDYPANSNGELTDDSTTIARPGEVAKPKP